ncbi:DNA-packaging protein [Rhizobium sp. LjRoot30]|uniref:DNA-packaging protein n=1 Tax=Rhizobium sp. LjRoot30 TaxID=3342320 RepID=UPI003ECE789E
MAEATNVEGQNVNSEIAKDANGRFLPGNRFWEVRSSHGAKPKFKKPDILWDACCEYFQWVEDNPLYEDKAFAYQGAVTHEPVAKMRAMTLAGLCSFLDISTETWGQWRKSRPDLSEVISKVENIIYQQKFAGAAADLLNANIIARDLGLADKQEHTGKDGAPIAQAVSYKIDEAVIASALEKLRALTG